MNNHSFSQSELLLLTESTDQDVQVHTPDVPPESTRLYPKLVGSHWECYITTDRLVLGRSSGPDAPPTRNNRQHRVDVDFGQHKKDVSRCHADIRFNPQKKRWELRVYGRNGAKVNHEWKKPSSRSVVLTTGSLIEIVGNRFVFILPDRSAPVTTTDDKLENLIIHAFRDHELLDTSAIVDYVSRSDQPYDRPSVVHALVLSKKFHLVDQMWTMRQPLTTQMSLDDIEYDYGPAAPPAQERPVRSLGISVHQIYSTWLAAKRRASDDHTPDNGQSSRRQYISGNFFNTAA
ncbi:hypothetical protein BJV82DRAFT_635192 [Fennellomyces sp. T-0311]|nr:hypothetical protein BJV82DRAFT_635192 [Fennellomyces sp. T-0311]